MNTSGPNTEQVHQPTGCRLSTHNHPQPKYNNTHGNHYEQRL